MVEFFTERLTERTKYFSPQGSPLNINKKPLNIFGEEITERGTKGYGSLYRTNAPKYTFSKGDTIISKSSYIPAFESDITHPFQRKYYDFQQVWGKASPEPKAWIQGYRKPRSIVKEINAEQRLMPKFEVIHRPAWNPKTIRTSGLVIPERMLGFKPYTIMGYGGMRLGSTKFMYDQRKLQIPEHLQFQSTLKTPIYGGLPASSFKKLQTSLQMPEMKIDKSSRSIYIQSHDKLTDTLKLPAMKTSHIYNYSYSFPPFIPLRRRLSGGGGGVFGGGISSPFYKFREFKIPELKIA